MRRKSVGNCRFIGELFKLKMLTSKIMLSCISQLLSSSDEEQLECLCKLLTTIGKELDTKVRFLIFFMNIIDFSLGNSTTFMFHVYLGVEMIFVIRLFCLKYVLALESILQYLVFAWSYQLRNPNRFNCTQWVMLIPFCVLFFSNCN